MPQKIQSLALMLPALLLSLSVHEYAHAWMATRLGDSTPEREGRLTLSPLAHLDPIGSLVFPVMIAFFSGGIFGWAKPVPFQPRNFDRRVAMRTGAAMTAAAGPLSNVLLAILSAIVLFLLTLSGLFSVEGLLSVEGQGEMVFRFLAIMISLNLILAAFNLLPIPPLDGSYLLPRSMDDFKERIAPFSFLIILALFLIDIPGIGTLGSYLFVPVEALAFYMQRSAILWAS